VAVGGDPIQVVRVHGASTLRAARKSPAERKSAQRRLVALKLRRTGSDKAPKHSGEVAWIRKTRDNARVQYGALRIAQRNLCRFDSLLQHITVGCATHAFLEQLRKMVGTHARQFGEVGQADIIREIVAYVVKHSPQAISGKPAFEYRRHAALY